MTSLNSNKGLFDLNRTELFVMLSAELEFANVRYEPIISKTANYNPKGVEPVRKYKFQDWATTNVFLFRKDGCWPCEIKYYKDVTAWDMETYSIYTIQRALNIFTGELLNDLIDIANTYFECDSK